MNGGVAGSQVWNQGFYYVVCHGNEGVAEKWNHVTEGLQSTQVHFAISVCEPRRECIKHLHTGKEAREGAREREKERKERRERAVHVIV